VNSWLTSKRQIPGVLRSTKASVIGAVLIAGSLVALGFVLDRQNLESYQRDLHQKTEQAAETLKDRLSKRIGADLSVARQLSYLVSVDADHSTVNLGNYARRHLADNDHFVAIGLAPNFVLTTLLPAASVTDHGDEIVRNAMAQQIALAMKDEISGFNLQQPLLSSTANNTLTIVMPVMVDQPGEARAWGAVALVLDEQKFLAAAGIGPETGISASQDFLDLANMHFAIRESGSADTQPFAGNSSIIDARPATRSIAIPGGGWEVMAVPKDGWESAPENTIPFRLALVLATITMLVPIGIASLLVAERNRNIAKLKAREANLLELSQRFNLAMESSNIGIWELIGTDLNLFWDERAANLHGCIASEGGNRIGDWLDALHPADRALAEAHFFNCSCFGTTCSEVYRIGLGDGTFRYLRSVGAHYEGSGGDRTTGIVWDVTADMLVTQTLRDAKETSDIKNAELELALDELSSREQELEELSQKLDLALGSYECGIWENNPDAMTEVWDGRMCQLYGIAYSNRPLSPDYCLSLVHPDDRGLVLQYRRDFMTMTQNDGVIFRVPLADGSIRYLRAVGRLQESRDGARKVVGMAFDVTQDALLTAQLKAAKTEADTKNIELELTKSRVEHNALHDPLTMLANRRKLDVELYTLSKSSLDSRLKLSILHLDLDRFKQINDTLGHAAGDAMLVHVSKILAKNVRRTDIVARIGGDEFVILAKDNNDPAEMAELASRIIRDVRQPIDFEGFSCRCGVSIGIAQASGFRIDARRVLINADIALYRAKGLGRSRYEFFTQNLQAEIINNKRMGDEILTGLEKDEFISWYQPQFDARTMQLTGVEALVRWNHPTRGILTPDAFLKIAEELNVVAVLDRIVLETALKDKMRWAARGIHVPKVSVNVSAKRLHDEHLLESLTGLSIAPGEISFELVESIFLDDNEASTSSNLDRIKALGIDIEIDDFGTGHTSIVSLLKLKPKRLKIDRQLVMPIIHSPQERALVRSIIEIARSLGVETVAEGVETLEHAAMLRQLGCDLLQGYAFAKPISFEGFTELASRSAWHKAS
jgi:diguanylate cyclase (GGDEF)-like protein